MKGAIDGRLKKALLSLSELLSSASQEFSEIGHAERRAKATAAQRVKSENSARTLSPERMKSFLSIVAHEGFRSADLLEKVDYHQAAMEESLNEISGLLPFLQSERPFGVLNNYAVITARLRDISIRWQQLRLGFRTMTTSPFRSAISAQVREMIEASQRVLELMILLPNGDDKVRGKLTKAQELLREIMIETRGYVTEMRERFFGGMKRNCIRFGHCTRAKGISIGESREKLLSLTTETQVKEILGLHVVMSATYRIADDLASYQSLNGAWIPWSLDPIKATVWRWLDVWSLPASTIQLRRRVETALTVALVNF